MALTTKMGSNRFSDGEETMMVSGSAGYMTEKAFEADPNYKATRTHNNSMIDDFYNNLMQQSTTLSISTFRNDLMEYQVRSRAEACRPPQAPVVVNKILPGQEQKFLDQFIQQITPMDTNQLLLGPNVESTDQYFFDSVPRMHDMIVPVHEQVRMKRLQISQEPNAAHDGTLEEIADWRDHSEPGKEVQLVERRSRRSKHKQSRHEENSKNDRRNGNSSHKIAETTTNDAHSQSRPKRNASNPVVFFEIEIDGEERGRIIMELFKDVAPKTVENFRQLSTGEKKFGFGLSFFHRIIPEFMCQGGDFVNSNGTGGYSIYGDEFEDENFELRHEKPFMLSMANCGPNTNGSQFFITFTECPHLDGKHVVFGQVLNGFHVCKDIELCGTESGEVTREVKIVKCGQLE